MRNLLYCAMAAIVSISLAAQTTGRISGKVTDSTGKPIPNVSVVIKRLDVTNVRDIKVNPNGSYLQVGLHPTEWELTVSAEGYIGHTEIVKIPLGDNIVKDITLKTLAEQAQSQSDIETPDLGRSKADEAVNAYNEAVGLFNSKNHVEAMAKIEGAIQNFTESLDTLTDEATKSQVENSLVSANKLFAFCQYEVAKVNAEQRGDLWLKAESALKDNLEKTPNDAYIAQALADIAGFKGDTEAENRYNELVEKIEGPQAGSSYNKAVDLFNAGNFSGAKPHLKKAIEIDPKFANSYYLLAICEFGDGKLAAAKANLQKYMELAPSGKYAAEVKEMLSDPNFR